MAPQERTVRWNDTAQVIRPPAMDFTGESAFRKRIREATEERDRLFKKARIADRPTRKRPQGHSETSDGTNVAKVEIALRRLSIPGASTMGIDSATSQGQSDSADLTKGIPAQGDELTPGGDNLKIPELKGVDEKDIALRAIPFPPRPPRTGKAVEHSKGITRDPASRPQVPLRPGRKPTGISPRPDACGSPATPAAIPTRKGKGRQNNAVKTESTGETREQPEGPSSQPADTLPEVVEVKRSRKASGRKGKANKKREQPEASSSQPTDTPQEVIEVAMSRKGTDHKGKAKETPAQPEAPSSDHAETHFEVIEVAMPPKGPDRKGQASTDQRGEDNRPEVGDGEMPPRGANHKGKARADQRAEQTPDPTSRTSTPAAGSRAAWTPSPAKSVEPETVTRTTGLLRSDFTIADILSSAPNCRIAQKPADMHEIKFDREKRARIRENLLQKVKGASEKKLTRERDRLKAEGFTVEPQFVKECVTVRARHNAMGEDDPLPGYLPLDGPLICGLVQYETGLQTRWERRQTLFDMMLPILDDLDAIQEEQMALNSLR